MRIQCGDGHWFTYPGPCPYGPPGDPCGYVPPEPEPAPPPIRENFDRQVAAPDRDALMVARRVLQRVADEDGELHGDAISAMWIIDSVTDAGPLSPTDTPEEA